jgi:hypothetical protein
LVRLTSETHSTSSPQNATGLSKSTGVTGYVICNLYQIVKAIIIAIPTPNMSEKTISLFFESEKSNFNNFTK